ncbi:TrkH family potassium uptake protein [Paenibacillus sp.]|uniref:TrkH family potassium uptake protein n=1 Tax=Paenibacillus sp. TaxID=58172 RepID=UPI002811B310|nr:TrkH family potassium uptake protein [Paenibacillus sp.]
MLRSNVKRSIEISPQQWMVFGFAAIILLGTILLSLPISSTSGESLGLLDSFFMATSAVCVTGLAVFDPGQHLTMFGEIVLLVLVQLGGLGFMTFGVIIAVLLGKRLGLKERTLIQTSTNSNSIQGLVRLSLSIFFIALIVELAGSVILTLRWAPDMGIGIAAYYAVFHSVSAFNNAGFSLWPDGLNRFVGDPVVNVVITFLFIVGGIGFTVLLDLFRKRRWVTLSLHSKIVLISTGCLLVGGFIVVFLLELLNPTAYEAFTWPERVWAAYFQSVTPRTAGFNTMFPSELMTATQFFIIFLMFIGASSGSTGGGIKTNTFVVLLLAVMSSIRGREQVRIFNRNIAYEIVLRALSVILISLGVVMLVAFVLTITERNQDFIAILFEATSAFSTVGLSLGITFDLSPAGKLLLSVTMFAGRLGPLTLAYALAKRRRESTIGYPEEKVLIG